MKYCLKWKIELGAYAPPGLDWRKEIQTYCCGLAGAFSFAFFWYLLRYTNAKSDLDWHIHTLAPGAVMKDFYVLMDSILISFAIPGAYMVSQAVCHYQYHSQGSKSIYLMKRLPDRIELHRRCLTLPAAGLVICGLTAFLTIALCYGIYLYFTPKECLSPHQWEMFWRFYR